jgi:hypothetical protein
MLYTVYILLRKLRKVHDTHAWACDLKGGSRNTEYKKFPSFHASIGLFRLRRIITGPLDSWPPKLRGTSPFQFGVGIDVCQNMEYSVG